MKKSWHGNFMHKNKFHFHALKSYIFMPEDEIFMHEISLQANEMCAPGMISFAPEMSWVGWDVHNPMHGIFTHVNLLAKLSF